MFCHLSIQWNRDRSAYIATIQPSFHRVFSKLQKCLMSSHYASPYSLVHIELLQSSYINNQLSVGRNAMHAAAQYGIRVCVSGASEKAQLFARRPSVLCIYMQIPFRLSMSGICGMIGRKQTRVPCMNACGTWN